MDLKYETLNGFTLAKLLCELDTRGFIIFVTIYEEMMFETFRYRLEAMEYLIKEEQGRPMARLRDCLTDTNMLVGNDKYDYKDYFIVKWTAAFFIFQGKISCTCKIAGEIHRVTFHAKDRILEFRGGLNTLEKDMGTGFLKTHRFCLVRTDKVRQTDYGDGTLVMEGGSVCRISRKGKRLLKGYFGKKEAM